LKYQEILFLYRALEYEMKLKSTYEKIMIDIKQRGEKATIDMLMVSVVIPTKKW